MFHLVKSEKVKVKETLTQFVKDDLKNHRPWYSKLFSNKLNKIPYPIASFLVFGWTVPVLAALELLLDWNSLNKHNMKIDREQVRIDC